MACWSQHGYCESIRSRPVSGRVGVEGCGAVTPCGGVRTAVESTVERSQCINLLSHLLGAHAREGVRVPVTEGTVPARWMPLGQWIPWKT